MTGSDFETWLAKLEESKTFIELFFTGGLIVSAPFFTPTSNLDTELDRLN